MLFSYCSKGEKKFCHIPHLQNAISKYFKPQHNWPPRDRKWNYPVFTPNKSTCCFLMNCVNRLAGNGGACVITAWIQHVIHCGHCSWTQGGQSCSPVITSAGGWRVLEVCQRRGIPLDCISFIHVSWVSTHRWAWCSPCSQVGRVSVWKNSYFNLKILSFKLVQEKKIFTV